MYIYIYIYMYGFWVENMMIEQLRGMRVRSGLVGIFKVTSEAQGKSIF